MTSIYKRAAIPPGLPVSNPTTSYWQDPPDADIADLRSTEELPKQADVVIIGSGITGSCIALEYLERTKGAESVVVLEARQACSGATGRNGGHTKTASYRYFFDNARKHGEAEALKIARLEYNTMKGVHAFARERGIQCDSRELETVDAIYDADDFERSKQAIQRMKELMDPNEGASKYAIWNAEQAEERFLTPGAVGAITYEAGSLSAYKLVIGVLKLALKQGLNLQTNTPVDSFEKASGQDAEGRWTVKTSRGSIVAKKLVLATNGYTPHLYPALQGMIVPLRGVITAHRPGSAMPKTGLGRSYSFIYTKGFDYMIERPQGSKFAGDIVIGGGFAQAPSDGIFEYGNTDDSSINQDSYKYLYDSTPKVFGKNWGEDFREGRIRKTWTGIMGYSADGHPLVGALPDGEGLYIAASFQGHGMVFCFMCAKALNVMMFGEDGDDLDAWFPRSFRMRKERIGLKFTGMYGEGEAEDLKLKTSKL